MGRIITPTFRVECVVGPGSPAGLTSAAWHSRYSGRPTVANLKRYVMALVASFAPGGCNAHARPAPSIVKGAPGAAVPRAR